jgi:DHA2 family multidrug resistance protein
MKAGMSPHEAELAGIKALEGTVTVQSHHLAYMDAFSLIALLFALALPLLLLIRIPKGEKVDLSSAH